MRANNLKSTCVNYKIIEIFTRRYDERPWWKEKD